MCHTRNLFATIASLPLLLLLYSSILTTAMTSSTSSSYSSFYRHLPMQVKKLSDKATLPSRGSDFAAGLDLSSAHPLIVPAGQRALIKTDLAIAVPPGTYARIAPRSGLAYKKGIDVGAGVIDADYRGPVGVILFNHGQDDFEIKVGDRIAQLILEQIVLPDVMETNELPEMGLRGEGGFGSTGVETKKQRTISPANSNEENQSNEGEMKE